MRRLGRQRVVFARIVAGLLAAALFSGPLLESAHEASVRHVRCPEDGELIDAPLQARHAHAPQTNDGLELFPEREQPATPAAAGHDHCAIVLSGHLRARTSDVPRLTQPQATAAAAPARLSSAMISGVALYLLAPKSGPPQA